ncbi:MAG: holo-ACP synthase [Candidatus Melainabacteria bacterium]|jgi:holo-[acyl-carrier protein] synthase|nr:holo-ACP synthase [Candidatus Melainabacteria bacterium]
MRLGNDLCNPSRIEKIYKRFGAKFLQRLLTKEEIEDLLAQQSKKLFIHRLAGRYAAKEAIAKLFGTGIGQELSFQDIQIIRDLSGKPLVKLSAKATKLAKKLKIKDIQVSISHEDTMVLATAISSS